MLFSKRREYKRLFEKSRPSAVDTERCQDPRFFSNEINDLQLGQSQ